MRRLEMIDPAYALDRRAVAEGWPFHCDSKLEFERPELNRLRDIWHAVADTAGVPARTDFDARTLKPFLRNISILERVFVDSDKWRYRIRLMGSAIAEIAGDSTGHFLDQQLAPEFLRIWTNAHDAVLDGGMPMRFVSDFRVPQLSYLDGESMLTPLADAHGRLTLILSCLYFTPKKAGAAA